MSYLRGIGKALTWPKLLTTQVLAQISVLMAAVEEGRWGQWMQHESLHNAAAAAAAFVLLVVALMVDEAMKGGAPPRRAFPIAIAISIVVSCAMTDLVLRCYELVFHVPPVVFKVRIIMVVVYGVGFATVGAFAMLVYLNRRTTERMLERVRSAELRRIELEQQLVASRLAAAEAQVDPQMLFAALSDIRASLDREAPNADTKLDELVQRLRRALAGTVVAADTETGGAIGAAGL